MYEVLNHYFYYAFTKSMPFAENVSFETEFCDSSKIL